MRANNSSRLAIQMNLSSFSALLPSGSVSVQRIFNPFRIPFFFTPLILCVAIIRVGCNAVKGVKYNVVGVKVISPGDEVCCAGKAIIRSQSNTIEIRECRILCAFWAEAGGVEEDLEPADAPTGSFVCNNTRISCTIRTWGRGAPAFWTISASLPAGRIC